jgi:type I restriction enzyme S subunit
MSWDKVKLGEIVTISTGKYDVNHSDVNGTYPFFTCAMAPFRSNTFSFDDEMILIPGNGANVGEVMYYKGKIEAYQRTYVLHKVNADVKYLFFYLKGNWKNAVSNQQYGSATNYIRLDNITELEIPLPPLPIQQRIAEILDTADALRRKDQELLKKYDELAQAIFIDMFGDPVKNEKGWEVKTIEQIVKKERHSIKRGPFGGALKKDIFVSSGFLVYEQYHALNNDFTFQRYFINEQKYKELIAFDVKPGDIIISCSGIYLGKLSIVPENALPGIINQALLKISLDNKLYNSEFFIKVFSQKNFKEKYFASERGAAIPNFPPMSAFKEFRFICPPIEMQNEYLGIVNNIKKQVDQINYQISNSDRLFQNLILKSFSGELVN